MFSKRKKKPYKFWLYFQNVLLSALPWPPLSPATLEQINYSLPPFCLPLLFCSAISSFLSGRIIWGAVIPICCHACLPVCHCSPFLIPILLFFASHTLGHSSLCSPFPPPPILWRLFESGVTLCYSNPTSPGKVTTISSGESGGDLFTSWQQKQIRLERTRRISQGAEGCRLNSLPLFL